MDGDERGRPVEILFVGSDADDVESTRSALRDDGISNAMVVLPTVSEALEHLHGGDDDADAPRPDVILLDCDSVDDDPEELSRTAETLQGDPPVPVIALRDPADGDDAGGAALQPCLEKPIDGVDLVERLVTEDGFWVRIVNGPHRR